MLELLSRPLIIVFRFGIEVDEAIEKDGEFRISLGESALNKNDEFNRPI